MNLDRWDMPVEWIAHEGIFPGSHVEGQITSWAHHQIEMPTHVQLVCTDHKLSWLQGHAFSNPLFAFEKITSLAATCPCWSKSLTITSLQAFRLDGDDADVCHQLGLMLLQTETTLKTYEARFQEARPTCGMFMHVPFFSENGLQLLDLFEFSELAQGFHWWTHFFTMSKHCDCYQLHA